MIYFGPDQQAKRFGGGRGDGRKRTLHLDLKFGLKLNEKSRVLKKILKLDKTLLNSRNRSKRANMTVNTDNASDITIVDSLHTL